MALVQNILPPGYIDPQMIFGPSVNSGIWKDCISQAGQGFVTGPGVYSHMLRNSPPVVEVHAINWNAFGPNARGTKTVKKP
jgi:hypothetical protein